MFKSFYESWVSSSPEELLKNEKLMLEEKYSQSTFVEQNVLTKGGYTIRTVRPMEDTDENKANSPLLHDGLDLQTKPPLLLIHGFGGGLGLWTSNFRELSQRYTVFAIDVPGFAGSQGHPDLPDPLTAASSQQWFVRGIEDWREAMKLEKLHVLGHSMGGYIAASYAMNHSERVENLTLVSPFGFKELTEEKGPGRWESRKKTLPWYIRSAVWVGQKVGPLTLARMLGPVGKSLMKKRNQYDNSRYNFPDNRASDYIFQCAMQCHGGEKAFWALNQGFGYAKEPLIRQVNKLKMPLTLIYGEADFITPDTGIKIRELLPHNRVRLYIVRGAGHHCYASRADAFNKVVSTAFPNLHPDAPKDDTVHYV